MSLRVEYQIAESEITPAPVPSSSSSAALGSRRSWLSRWAAPILLFLIGCFALGYYAYDILDARFFQDDQSRQFDQALSNAHDKAAADLSAEAAADLNSHASRANTWPAMPSFSESSPSVVDTWAQPAPTENMPLGRIEINSLGLTAMIQEGTSAQTLQRGVGHITGTAQLGKSGNVGLAAHRDTFFRKLRNIHEGEEITLTTLNGAYKYRVELISIVEPEDSAVLRNTGENILTLVTCYPFNYIGSAPKRFIVRAKEEPSAPDPFASIK
jgi:sortase A